MTDDFDVVDLRPDDFPFTVEFFDVTDLDHPLDAIHVTGPGALRVPGYGVDGREVMIRVTFGDGSVTEEWPA